MDENERPFAPEPDAEHEIQRRFFVLKNDIADTKTVLAGYERRLKILEKEVGEICEDFERPKDIKEI